MARIRDTPVGTSENDAIAGIQANDRLYGNDFLMGGGGKDTLVGGAGNDRFVYATDMAFTQQTIGSDQIKGFRSGQDKLLLDRTTFTALRQSKRQINPEKFALVERDRDATTHKVLIVHNTNNGKLFYSDREEG